ncbi:hypothetical protein N9W78_02175, partial [bacterium]|nr:hypothetical protein [bacterium]
MAPIGNKAPESRRLGVIDGLRGLAILGILIMNIQAFGRIERAYLLPDIHEPLSVLDRWFQGLGYFLAEQVFVSLLSCLFGIGIWLLAQNDQRAGRNPVTQQRRRSLGLLFIGLLHAYLIWTGDILVAYALAAWLLAPAVHWSARRQWQIGLLCLAVMPALGVLEVVAIPVESRQAIYSADPAAFQAEIQALTGSWWQNQHWRMARTLEVHLLGLPFGTLWFVAGWMLVGMALYRSGYAAGGWSSRNYMRVMVATLLAGLLIKAAGYPLHFQPAWVSLSWSLFSQVGAACQMLAY